MFETLMNSSNLPILLSLLIVISLLIAVISANKYELFSAPAPSVLDSRPVLWFVLDDQANTRKWADFSTRNSKQNNRGYTEHSFKAAKHTQGRDFQVLRLNGREDVVKTLKSYGAIVPENIQLVPSALWREYTRAALLANAGGLYVDGDSVLFVGPAIKPFIESYDSALFGINPDEPIVSGETALKPGPSSYLGYAKTSKQPAWIEAETEWKTLIAAGPPSFTAAIANRSNQKSMEKLREAGVQVVRQAEANRKKDGTYLNLYDIFARAPSKPDTSVDISNKAAYISFDSDLLERSAQLSFVLKLSPQQIEESDFLFSRLVKKALNS